MGNLLIIKTSLVHEKKKGRITVLGAFEVLDRATNKQGAVYIKPLGVNLRDYLISSTECVEGKYIPASSSWTVEHIYTSRIPFYLNNKSAHVAAAYWAEISSLASYVV